MRLTILSNQALRALIVCASNHGQLLRSADIAATCNASKHHTAQIIHCPVRISILASTQGRSGGVCLVLPPAEINIGSALRQMEGEILLLECFDPDGCTCSLDGACRMNGHFAHALDALYSVLESITLAGITSDDAPLDVAGDAASSADRTQTNTTDCATATPQAGASAQTGGAPRAGKAPNTVANGLPENPSQLRHIFGNRTGHLPDTPENRQLLLDTRNNQANSLGTNRLGNKFYISTAPNSSQIWVENRICIIYSRGTNNPPRT